MSGLRDELAALVASPNVVYEWSNQGRSGTAKAVGVDRLRALLDRFPPEAEEEAERFEHCARCGAKFTGPQSASYSTCYRCHTITIQPAPAPRPTTEGGSSNE